MCKYVDMYVVLKKCIAKNIAKKHKIQTQVTATFCICQPQKFNRRVKHCGEGSTVHVHSGVNQVVGFSKRV